MNVSLSYNNMFKWGGPLDIKGDGLFWYPNHALIQKQKVSYGEIQKTMIWPLQNAILPIKQ